MNVLDYNRWAWDRQVEQKNQWTIPVDSQKIREARKGEWTIFLTPTKPIPRDWLPNLRGKKVLCLASGGGQQGPVLAAAGAVVTVFDNSPKQLEQDRFVADREKLEIDTVEGDMTNLSIFPDATFDFVVHPVSNLFVPDVKPVWEEVFRVIRKGGILVAGFNNPVVYIFDLGKLEKFGKLEVKNPLPYSDEANLSVSEKAEFKKKGIPFEFSHSLESQIGGQISAGFLIDGFFEDSDKKGENPINFFLQNYIATHSKKP